VTEDVADRLSHRVIIVHHQYRPVSLHHAPFVPSWLSQDHTAPLRLRPLRVERRAPSFALPSFRRWHPRSPRAPASGDRAVPLRRAPARAKPPASGPKRRASDTRRDPPTAPLAIRRSPPPPRSPAPCPSAPHAL